MKWIRPTSVSGLDPVADVDERLPEAGVRSEEVVLLLGRADDHRRAEAEALARRDLPGEHAEVAEDIGEPALGDTVGRRGDVASTAELGRHDDLPLALGLADEQARAGDVDVDEVHVGVPREHAVDHLPALLGVVDPVHLGPRRAERRAATAVHVDDDVGERDHEAREVVGELLVGSARPASPETSG